MSSTTMNLGDLMSALYEEFLAFYGDEDIAAVATAAMINEILAEQARLSKLGSYAELEIVA